MKGILVVIVTVAAYLVMLTGSPAHASDCPPGTQPQAGPKGTICIPVVNPGNPGEKQPGETNPPGATGGGHQTCTYNGSKIPCSGPNGVWFSAQQCYASPATPQPPPGDEKWDGNDPADGGTVYLCVRPAVEQSLLYFYVPPNGTPALVDPGELAQEALESMELAVPDVQMAPTPPDMTYVNLETWLWMSPGKFATLTKTAAAGPTSVTVTAKPVRAWWDMGDGGEKSCTTAGKAWKSWMDDAATTDCSYTYKETSGGGMFKVRVAIWYQADWTCSGACLRASGTLDEVSSLTGSRSIRVGERQSVIVGGGS